MTRSLWAGKLDHILPKARPQLLRELTLAALTDLPDDLARSTLRRWIDADSGDVDARVALLRRIGAEPRADDPDRESRLVQLRDLLASHPEHVDAREAVVAALADAGEPERGQTFLETWPLEQRDGRFWRLRGRWDLEHDHRPDQAVAAFEPRVDFPQDWRSHYYPGTEEAHTPHELSAPEYVTKREPPPDPRHCWLTSGELFS